MSEHGMDGMADQHGPKGVHFCLDTPGVLAAMVEKTKETPDGLPSYDPFWVCPRDDMGYRVMVTPPAVGDIVWLNHRFYTVSRRVYLVLSGYKWETIRGEQRRVLSQCEKVVILLKPMRAPRGKREVGP